MASHRVIVTGGCGFLGQMLARSIIKRGRLVAHTANGEQEVAVSSVVLTDTTKPDTLLFPDLAAHSSIELGDVSDAAFCRSLFADTDGGSVSVFHLGAIMSGQGETDFDRCVDVNLHGTLHMLEAARSCGAPRPRFVMASAGATLGAGAPTDFVGANDVVSDATRATPHTTYGMTKACAELLVADYSRRGFVDGRGCRLPSVAVRAGAPNAATTSCFSSVVREPLAGAPTTSPVAADVRHAVTSGRTAVAALLAMHDAPAAQADAVLGFDRTVFVPSIALTLADLEAATRRVVAPECHGALGAVTYAPDEKLSAAVASFPARIDCGRARALGIRADLSAESIVREYAEDFPAALAKDVRLAEAPPMAPRPRPKPAAERAVALVTGGGSGIGQAVAVRLAEGGWSDAASVAVIVAGRRRDALEETAAAVRAAGAEALVCPADLTREDDVARLFEEIQEGYGRLDLLFNNAGAGLPPTNVDAMELGDWRRIVDINLNAMFHVSRDAFRMMAAQQPQGGRIVNNGSVSAASPRPGSVAYTATKHAVTGLTKSLSLDGRASSIAAGQIDYGNVVSAISAGMAVGMPQPDGSVRPEPRMDQRNAANAVHYMASLPLGANVLQMTVMATNMPFVGRG